MGEERLRVGSPGERRDRRNSLGEASVEDGFSERQPSSAASL
jgi:hypothetical protein